MSRILYSALLLVVLACFAKIVLLNGRYGRITSTELIRAQVQIKEVENVVLYEETYPFRLNYTVSDGYEFPYILKPLNTVTIVAHGEILQCYGVTIDSFSSTGDRVYYRPMAYKPNLTLEIESIEEGMFAESRPQDYKEIRRLALEKAPELDFEKVCFRFDSLVTAHSHGAIEPVRK